MLMCKMQSHLKAFTNIYTLKLLKILGHKIIIMNDMRMNHSLHIGTYVEYDIVYRSIFFKFRERERKKASSSNPIMIIHACTI